MAIHRDSVCDSSGLNRCSRQPSDRLNESGPEPPLRAAITDGTPGDMSRLFSSGGVCARTSRLVFRKSSLPTKDGAAGRVKPALLQQQRRCIGTSNAAVKVRSVARIWICGGALGVALAVGLKGRSDAASDLGDGDGRSDRYSEAIKVSRDLVERIRVRAVHRDGGGLRSKVKGRAFLICNAIGGQTVAKARFGGPKTLTVKLLNLVRRILTNYMSRLYLCSLKLYAFELF